MDDFPSNSQQERKPGDTAKPKPITPVDKSQDKKEIEPVIKGTVRRRKKPLGTRFKETFFNGSAKDAAFYVASDVMLPRVRDTLLDMIVMGSERLIIGESRASRTRGSSSYGRATYTNYNKSSSRPPWEIDPREQGRPLSRDARSRHNFDEIIFDSRGQAEVVLDTLFELSSKYGVVMVSDLYRLTNITPAFTDQQWGWEDLRGSGVRLVRGGYLLELPQPIPLKR